MGRCFTRRVTDGLLGADDRALEREERDGEIGEAGEDLLLVLERGPETLHRSPGEEERRLSEAVDQSAFGADRAPGGRAGRRTGGRRTARAGKQRVLRPAGRAQEVEATRHRALEQRARDEQPIDLVRALPDSVDATITVGAGRRIVLDVAIAAMDLDELVDHAIELFGGEDLGDRAFDRQLLERPLDFLGTRVLGAGEPRIDQPRDAVDDGLDHVCPNRHLRQLSGHERKIGDGAAERASVVGVGGRGPQRRFHRPERGRRELEASDVQDVEGDAVAFADFPEQVFRRHANAVERQRTRGRAVDPELLFLATDRQSGGTALDEERAERFAIDLGVHREQIGEAAVRDELLAAVQAPRTIRFAAGAGPDCLRVGTRARLSQRVRADRRPGGEARQVAVSLLIGSEEDQRQRPDSGVCAVGDRKCVGGGERFCDDDAGRLVEASTAECFGHVDPHEPVASQDGEQVAVGGVVLRLERVASRLDLTVDESGDGVADRALLRRQPLGSGHGAGLRRFHEKGATRLPAGTLRGVANVCLSCHHAASASRTGCRPPSHSMTPAAPWPPPTHIVTSPYRASRRASSDRIWTVSFAPVAPSG
jgi:hypothetical protein